MACGGVPMTEKTWHEHIMRQQHALAAHSSPFGAAPAGHVSAAGHYGYQPPAQQSPAFTATVADKENAAMDFQHGVWPMSAHVPGAGLGAGCGLAVRKRGRDEVLFQEFKRRRLTEPEAMAMAVESAPAAPLVSEPVAAPAAPAAHAGWRAGGAAPRCLMRHMI